VQTPVSSGVLPDSGPGITTAAERTSRAACADEQTGRTDGWSSLLGGRASAVLVIGTIALCGLAGFTAYIFDSVLEGDGITAVDWPTVAWLADHRQPVLTSFMSALSIVGSAVSATATAIVICALVAWRIRRWLPVVIAAPGMAGYALTVTVVKLVVHPQRPPLRYSLGRRRLAQRIPPDTHPHNLAGALNQGTNQLGRVGRRGAADTQRRRDRDRPAGSVGVLALIENDECYSSKVTTLALVQAPGAISAISPVDGQSYDCR